MAGLLRLTVFSIFLFHLFSLGMQKNFCLKKTKEISKGEVVHLTEDPDNLPASDEFRLSLKNVSVRDSYNFLCSVVESQPEVAQKKLGNVIAKQGPFLMRVPYKAIRLTWDVDKYMIDEWLNRREQVGNMLVRPEGKDEFSIGQKLFPELEKKKGSEKIKLAKGVGKYAAARLFYNMRIDQNAIIKRAKKLVEKAWKTKEQKTKLERGREFLFRAFLDRAVPWMITFFTKNEDELKNFFGEIAGIASDKESSD